MSPVSSRKVSALVVAILLLCLFTVSAFAQDARNSATTEPTSSAKPRTDTNPAVSPAYTTPRSPLNAAYGAKIAEYTTEKYFMTELVDHLPASDKVPSPDKSPGLRRRHAKQADATRRIMHRYYRELASSQPACSNSDWRRKKVKRDANRCWCS